MHTYCAVIITLVGANGATPASKFTSLPLALSPIAFAALAVQYQTPEPAITSFKLTVRVVEPGTIVILL